MSTTTTVAGARQEIRSIRRPPPLLPVLSWELRRFRGSRLFWLQALAFFCLVVFVTWFASARSQITLGINAVTFTGSVAGTSPWGLFQHLPNGSLLLLGVLLPFVTADGVSRDLSRRTHELLMSTRLPSRSYVWGRYLIGLLMSLGLALVLLAATLAVGLLQHLSSSDYPAPELNAVLLLWVGMVVPATFLLSSVSFALGTLLPRQATLVKITVLMGWFIGVLILPTAFSFTSGHTPIPAWYINWDPTSAVTAEGMLTQYQTAFDTAIRMATSATQIQHILTTVENMMPDVSAWLGPHLILAACSLLTVLLAAFTFQRFRGVFSA